MDRVAPKYHFLAILFFVVCATGYLFDVLFLDKHLSAFDIFLDKPSWEVEFGNIKPHNAILSDSPTAHYPYKKEYWGAMRHGYNTPYLPHIFTGKPTPGQGVGIFATSLFQFFMDIPNALDWSTWFRLVLAAVFMYVLLVQLGLAPGIASLGAVAWAFNTHQIAWLMYPHHLATELWLPLLLSLNLLVLRATENTRLIASAGLVLAVVFFFTSNFTQIILYAFIFIGLFNTLYVLMVQRAGAAEKIRTWSYTHIVYLVAGLVLLPEALWLAQEISEGLRGSQQFRYDSNELTLSFSALTGLLRDLVPSANEVVRLFMPNYHGEFGSIPDIRGFFEDTNKVEFQAYFGLICVYFCVYGVVKGLFRRDRLLLVLIILLVLAFGILNGNRTLTGLLKLIPFGGAGVYSRIITLVLLFATILAAFGASFFLEDLKQKRYIFVAVSLAVLLLWLISAKYRYADILALREFAPWMLYLAIFLVVAIVLAIYQKSALIIPIAIVLTCTELLIAGYLFNTRLESKYHFPENTVIKTLRAAQGDFRTALLMDNTAYHHNILTYYDLSTIGGYSTIVPNNYLQFIRGAYGNVQITLNGIVFLFDGNIDVLRLLNTRFIVTNLDIKSDAIRKIYSNKVDTLYEFKNPLERVYCASHQFVKENSKRIPKQLGKLAKKKKYDRPVVFSEKLLDQEVLTENCKVSDLKVYTAKLKFSVTTDQPTLVFIPVNHHAYWRGKINNASAPIHKANYTFMALKVPAGTSKVELEFINTKLTVSAVFYIVLGLIVILVALRSTHDTVRKAVLILPALLLIGKSLFFIPGIMNSEIPERVPSNAATHAR